MPPIRRTLHRALVTTALTVLATVLATVAAFRRWFAARPELYLLADTVDDVLSYQVVAPLFDAPSLRFLDDEEVDHLAPRERVALLAHPPSPGAASSKTWISSAAVSAT